jgi:NADH:ubiquinone oxidoreductase subunit 5 (subunit L)/multisubunit Na+/H+ antiporter MnhA subunit
MPLPAWLLVIATLVPLGSFMALFAVGRQLGKPWAGVLATLALAISFACSIAAMLSWLQTGSSGGVAWGAGKLPILQTVHWADAAGDVTGGASAGATGGASGGASRGASDETALTSVPAKPQPPQHLLLGIYIDSLTVIMAAVVTLVALLVHIFSLGYMRQDPHDWRYFAQLGLFCTAMLALVMAATLIDLFICWELVGLCSYLLIGFYYERRSAANAANKAFITNRIGDAGFIIGLMILWTYIGTFNFEDLFRQVRAPIQSGSDIAGRIVRGNSAAETPDGAHQDLHLAADGGQVLLFATCASPTGQPR